MMKYVLMLGAVGALSACSILPEPAPADIVYRLSVSGESVQPAADATVIRVDRPSATTVFNTKSIIVSPDGRRLATAAQARFPETIPLMVQDGLIDAMSRSRSVVGVGPAAGTRTETRVHLTIKNFEAQFDNGDTNPPLAVVRYTATLANAADRTLLSTYATRQTVRSDAINVSEIVQALEKANDAALLDIVTWLEQTARTGEI